MYRSHVLVCGGTGCTSSGSQQIIETLEKEIAVQGLTDEVKVCLLYTSGGIHGGGH